jgi:hypothetical protein
MSFDKFIQTRTIAKTQLMQPTGVLAQFPTYFLSSFIDFETDGFLVGIHFMVSHNGNANASPENMNPALPNGAIVAKVSGDQLSLPAGGTTTDFSGAQVLISHLATPSEISSLTNLNPDSRQTTIAYDADSKRIPIKSNDRLGVYICSNSDSGENGTIFHYTLTAYFVRS